MPANTPEPTTNTLAAVERARAVYIQGDPRLADLIRTMAEARKQGHTYQQIAEAAGITRQRVHQLLNKEGT